MREKKKRYIDGGREYEDSQLPTWGGARPVLLANVMRGGWVQEGPTVFTTSLLVMSLHRQSIYP